MSRSSEQLALKKQLLLLRLESHRLEIEADVYALKNPVRNIAIGGGLLKLLRSHPILMTGASAILARIPRLGLLVKLIGAGMAVWQTMQMVRAWKR
jgi:hypothetical protein